MFHSFRAGRPTSERLAILLTIVLTGPAVQGQHYEYKEHHLGPTGLFGVTSPTDIRITRVQKGSPAEGRIRVGDVLVGAGGVRFDHNTRCVLADAIDRAETAEGRGLLPLRLASGRTVNLQLKVLGRYSPTAPYRCAKTDAIITQAADYLVRTRKFGRGEMNIGLLGLLATGEKKYIEVVRQEIHRAAWARPDLSFPLQHYARTAWSWGYTNLLLCEYYLLTGDDYVLPAIRAYSVAIARGRDAAGLWGHGMATLDLNDGQWHGRLPGYAVMNQSSLPLFISLLLAEKCGVRHPEIRAGIEQTHTFYADFIGRGTLPYGVHDPNPKSYNNNGMSGLAAVAFSLYGNRRGAAFFSQMSAAAHQTMETGHTGHFFNQMWTGLGANLAGPETAAAFFRMTRWLHTLNRTWEGGFIYDGCGYPNGTFSYRGLSDTGSHLLNYCLGRRALYITGKNADRSIWLSGRAVEQVIALADLDLKNRTDEQLLDLFDHSMPKVRLEALWTLRARKHALVQRIRRMIHQGTQRQRLGAIAYFGYGCPDEQARGAMEDLVRLMRNPEEDIELRVAAAGALCWRGKAAYPYFADMLKILLADKPGDPLGRLDAELGTRLNVLCADPYAAGLVTDKPLFYAAVGKLLDHRRAKGRTAGAKLIAHIPLEDFHYVADRLCYVLEDKDRTYHSYHNLGPITESIGILANLRIRGGLEAAQRIFDAPTGKAGFKIRMLMAVLPKYGAAARPMLEQLQADARLKNIEKGRFGNAWRAMVQAVEQAEGPATLMSIDQAKRAGQGGGGR